MKQKIFSEYYETLKHVSDVISISTSTKDFLNIPKQDNRVLFIKQAEQLFGSIDALVRIAGIESEDPHSVFMDALRFVLKETKGKEKLVQTFLEMAFLPSDESLDVQRVATSYFIQHMVTFIGVSAEIERRLIKNPAFIKTSFQYQLFHYINFGNAEKQLAEWVYQDKKKQYNRMKNQEALMQAANDLVKKHPSGQGNIGKMNRFDFNRKVEKTASKQKNITDKQAGILWNDEKQFKFMDEFFKQIEKMQEAAKLPAKALEAHIKTPVAELIPSKVKGWDLYFEGMIRKAVSRWVKELSICLDDDINKAPGRAKGKIGKQVEKKKMDRLSLDSLPETKMAPLDLDTMEANEKRDGMQELFKAKLKQHKITASLENVIRAFEMKAEGESMKEIKDVTGIDERSFNRYKKIFQDDRDLYKQLTKFLTPTIDADSDGILDDVEEAIEQIEEEGNEK